MSSLFMGLGIALGPVVGYFVSYGLSKRYERKSCAGPIRRQPTKNQTCHNAAQAADQGQQLQGHRQHALADHIDRVHGQKSAQTVVNRMPEGEHAALSQQHVVGKGKYDGDSHLTEHGQRETGAEHQR